MGEPNAAVKPFGRPETTLMLAPPVLPAPDPTSKTLPNNPPSPPTCPAYSLKAPLASTASPPTGVAVTVTVAVDSDCT